MESAFAMCEINEKSLNKEWRTCSHAYQKYEQGERFPSLPCLVQIADILDVPTDYLLERDEYLNRIGVPVDVYQ